MWVRIASGLGGLAALLPILIWGGALGVDVVCWLALLIAGYEYARMAFPTSWRRALWVLVPLIVGVFGGTVYGGIGLTGPLLLASLLVVFGVVMAWTRETQGTADEVGRLFLGAGYCALLAFVPLVRRLDHGVAFLFLLLASTWLGDTGAYFSGKYLGKHKMSPLLSPKKTWEGLFGGLVASVLGAGVVWSIGLQEYGLGWVLLLGALVDLSGVTGDLAESLLKRAFGVKDSGTIMPGHGGILDRIDSVLFSAPVLLLGATLLGA